MALARATSPAISVSGFQGSASVQAWTSNTFSPAAGSTIVVCGQALQSFNNVWNTPTITDTVGLTWTRSLWRADTSVSGYSDSQVVWWANCPSAQTNMTVTVTQDCNTGQTIWISWVSVDVFTGADQTNPIGASVQGNVAAGSAIAASITPAGSGSALLMLAANISGSTAMTAGTGEYLLTQSDWTGWFGELWYGTSGGPTIPATAQTMDCNVDTGGRSQYVAFEVLAASGGGGGTYTPPRQYVFNQAALARASRW